MKWTNFSSSISVVKLLHRYKLCKYKKNIRIQNKQELNVITNYIIGIYTNIILLIILLLNYYILILYYL